MDINTLTAKKVTIKFFNSQLFSGYITRKVIGQGGEGIYVRLNRKIGVKIFYTKEHAREARRQFDRMKKHQNTGMVPIPYELCKVAFKNEKLRYPAIIMQHISGKTLQNSVVPIERWDRIFDKIRKLIDPRDLHEQNIMISNKGRTYAIDI